ncbi:MAG: hypothetical protein LBP59_18115 [Planctomycetaceae bacterium]|jgi:hypothetical protein|nr:hypothetical protein [Planctomycetaceae bacterium]
MSEVTSQQIFLFALRQSAGETPAIRWSVNRFKNDPQTNGLEGLLKIDFGCEISIILQCVF